MNFMDSVGLPTLNNGLARQILRDTAIYPTQRKHINLTETEKPGATLHNKQRRHEKRRPKGRLFLHTNLSSKLL